ncbi:MAG: PEP/pyruvate-binding domain-containing protein [Pseudolysinimonas sp.]
MTVHDPQVTPMPMPWVRWLDECRVGDIESLGGKVAHLADFGAAGIVTPDGFGISADAYLAAIAASGLERALATAAERIDADPGLAPELCAECRRSILEMEMPPLLRSAVTEAYDRLMLSRGEADPAVAVRSSAIREDSEDASSAGQYTTVLGVTGAEGVLAAVQECWASLYSEHALLYRSAHGIRVEESPMAVGVIELVDARASGVAFSLDPVTGAPARLVIESTFGWGESLVQGHVTPDRYEVARDELRILRRRVGTKRVISTWSASGGGIQESQMPMILRETASLDDSAVLRIAETLLRIEEHFGCAVDVEWVWPKVSTGVPVIVQARPETVHRLTLDQLRASSANSTFDPLAFAFDSTFGGKARGTSS